MFIFNHLVRFLLVGGSATLIQFTLLFLFIEIGHLQEVAASALAFTFSAIYNYLMNYYFTFASQKGHLETATKFSIVAGLGLIINSSSFALLLTISPHYLFAQFGATLITLVVNFLLHKTWIYRS
jgi:putative flippase GtrA